MTKVIVAFIALLTLIMWSTEQANKGADNVLFSVVEWLPYGDKIGHFALFGALTSLSLLMTGHYRLKVKGIRLPLVYFPLFVYVIVDELLQLSQVNRTFDFQDLFSGLLGIIVFGGLTRIYSRNSGNHIY